jgi:hypothetical protein
VSKSLPFAVIGIDRLLILISSRREKDEGSDVILITITCAFKPPAFHKTGIFGGEIDQLFAVDGCKTSVRLGDINLSFDPRACAPRNSGINPKITAARQLAPVALFGQ